MVEPLQTMGCLPLFSTGAGFRNHQQYHKSRIFLDLFGDPNYAAPFCVCDPGSAAGVVGFR